MKLKKQFIEMLTEPQADFSAIAEVLGVNAAFNRHSPALPVNVLPLHRDRFSQPATTVGDELQQVSSRLGILQVSERIFSQFSNQQAELLPGRDGNFRFRNSEPPDCRRVILLDDAMLAGVAENHPQVVEFFIERCWRNTFRFPNCPILNVDFRDSADRLLLEELHQRLDREPAPFPAARLNLHFVRIEPPLRQFLERGIC